MTVEELVNRVEPRHRFFVSAFRAAHADGGTEPGGRTMRLGLEPKHPTRNAMMESVASLKEKNVPWKEIREHVEKVHGYRCDSVDALRKSFERHQKRHQTTG